MTSEINKNPSNDLLEKLNIQKENNQTVISQQAMIGKHKVNISLNIEGHVIIQKLTWRCKNYLEKIAEIVSTNHLKGPVKSDLLVLSVFLIHPGLSSISESSTSGQIEPNLILIL